MSLMKVSIVVLLVVVVVVAVVVVVVVLVGVRVVLSDRTNTFWSL